MEEEKQISREENPAFFKLWDLKCIRSYEESQKHLKAWHHYEIYAKTTKDFKMNVWNGTHPVETNSKEHVCKAGTRVRIWMVSRFGDVGITDNMVNPTGYNVRGLDADTDLTDYEFIERK